MKEISARELEELLKNKACVVIDVREPYEVEAASIGGKSIPMAEIMDRCEEIPRDEKVVVHCKAGKRSAAVIHALESLKGYTNLYNLKGGICAWRDEVDPDLNVT